MSLTVWEQAIHTYRPGSDGRCTSGWYNDQGKYIQCTSSQRSSVLHDDCESDFRQSHDHGGGDCMCFEDDNRPSYYEVMRRTCYPTPDEIAEEERQRVLGERRRRRVYALSQGHLIEKMAKQLTTDTSPEELQRFIKRAQKLQRWGIRA